MKIFIDTANLDEIREFLENPEGWSKAHGGV